MVSNCKGITNLAVPYSIKNICNIHCCWYDLVEYTLDSGRWFKKWESGWEIKELEDVCQKCTHPWCMWNKGKNLWKFVIRSIIDEYAMYGIGKLARCTVYCRTVNSRYGYLSWQTYTGFILDFVTSMLWPKIPNKCVCWSHVGRC